MRLRPSAVDDHDAVLRVLAERDLVDFGVPDFTASLLFDQWRSRGFSAEADAVVADDGDGVIGYAAVFPPGDLAFVHPAREGEGVGASLLRWAETRARYRGMFRQRVASRNASGRALLESAGYRRVRSVCFLGWDGKPALPVHPLPRGVELEAIDLDRSAAELHDLDLLAFSENADYRAETLEEFCDEHLSNPDVHRPSSRIARRGGQPLGFILCRQSGARGYVDLLAVTPAARRVGLGRALLCHALGALAADGARDVGLDVASDNPRALGLYRSLGMQDRHEVVVYEKAVGT
jgi:ribosomal protein S18 acetylase RimI-like enzyme